MRAIRVNDSNGHIVAGGFGRVDNGIVKHEEDPKLYDFLLKHAKDSSFTAINFVDAKTKSNPAPPAPTPDKKEGD